MQARPFILESHLLLLLGTQDMRWFRKSNSFETILILFSEIFKELLEYFVFLCIIVQHKK